MENIFLLKVCRLLERFNTVLISSLINGLEIYALISDPAPLVVGM